VRTLKLLGCKYFIATNASGSLHSDMPPGELMLLTDHINLQPQNPLVGPNDDEFGPRFVPLDNAYDKQLREHLLQTAEHISLPLHEGVYLCVMGPNYETAAEIKAFRSLGADAVGMSTVPEVLVANHCGMQVAAIATITNFATGLTDISHSHDEVLNMAHHASVRLTKILTHAISSLS
jgi:xanthosine phosphorylase